jgi:hypothetical protein
VSQERTRLLFSFVRLDRKLLLIAPTIVLFFVVAGMAYAALELHFIARTSRSLSDRSAFIGAVERGEKTLNPQQSVALLRLSLQVEERRSAALSASRDLLIVLSAIAFVSCLALVAGIRTVPREHWPRFDFGGKKPTG